MKHEWILKIGQDYDRTGQKLPHRNVATINYWATLYDLMNRSKHLKSSLANWARALTFSPALHARYLKVKVS